MLRISSYLALCLLALASGCSSTSKNVVSVEARADSAAALEVIGILFSGYVASDGSDPSSQAKGGSTTQYDTFDSDTFFRSAGWRASINTSVVDIVGGMDTHWYHDQSVPETSIGLRKRFPGSEPGAAYVELLLRHGNNLDTSSGEQDYDGIAIGFGGIAPISEHWFVDLCLVYERTLDAVHIDGDDNYLTDLLFRFGIGFSL